MNDALLLEKNKQLQIQIAELSLRHRLIAALLSADYIHAGVIKFQCILQEEFLPFINEETAYKEDATILLRLQNILAELKIISTYPEFYKKRTVAVAGGFSAGKSQFISSLFRQQNLRLPIGIQPTTAIPTYAMSNKDGEAGEILGCSIRGGTVALSKIDPNLQNKLSHDFLRSFGFNLKSIMPYLFLKTSMPYEHLCFIDTPGYNPSDTEDGFTHEDNKTAGEFIRSAEVILWLIGADANGTIPNTDLAFLRDITEQGKKIYIILNKADLKSPDDIENILDAITEVLLDEDISVVGISAYSSMTDNQNYLHGQEHSYRIESFHNFLQRINIPSNKHYNITTELENISELYIAAIHDEEKNNKKITAQLKSLELDLFQKDFIRPDDVFFMRINYLSKIFLNKKITLRIKKIKKISENLQKAVNEVFGGLPTYHDEPIIGNDMHNPKTKQSKVINMINIGMEKIESFLEYFSIFQEDD